MCGVPWANRDYAGADAQVYELIIVTGGGTRSPHDLQSIPASAGPYNPHASGHPSVLINIMNVSYGATRPPSGCGPDSRGSLCSPKAVTASASRAHWGRANHAPQLETSCLASKRLMHFAQTV